MVENMTTYTYNFTSVIYPCMCLSSAMYVCGKMREVLNKTIRAISLFLTGSVFNLEHLVQWKVTMNLTQCIRSGKITLTAQLRVAYIFPKIYTNLRQIKQDLSHNSLPAICLLNTSPLL